MKSPQRFGGPGLFGDLLDNNSGDASVDTTLERAQDGAVNVGSLHRRRTGAQSPLHERSQAATLEPKQRKRYQFGNLQIDHRERGPAIWSFRYFETVNGKRKRRKTLVGTIEEYPTESDALRACEHLRMRANAENPRSNATMQGLINRVIEEVLEPCLDVPLGGEVSEGARLEYSTACCYKSQLRNHVLPRWGNYRVQDFEKPEIQASVESWLHSLRRSTNNPDGLAPKSVQHVSAVMRVVFKLGVKWGYLSFNPLSEKRVELPRGCSKRLKTPVNLSPEQFLLLISHLKIRELLAVVFHALMSSRISEPLGVKWEDLDLQSRVVTFQRGFVLGRFSRLKTEPSRGKFSLPKDVVDLLHRWQEITPYNRPSDYVFASHYLQGKRPFSPRTLMNNIAPVARALGLPHIIWPTFRHSFARWAKNSGATIPHVQSLLRHGSPRMAGEIYGVAELESTRKVRDRVIRFLKNEGRKKQAGQEVLHLRLKTG